MTKCWAQDPYFLTLNKTSGLPANVVYDAYQDSQGFIWFATASGITRFDGNLFERYQDDRFHIKSMSNIMEDFAHRIWFQDFYGTIYYIQNDSIKKFEKAQANGFLRVQFIKDHLFIVTKKGLEIYDGKTFELFKSIPLQIKDIKQTIASHHLFYIVGDIIVTVDYDGIITKLKTPDDYKTTITAPILVANEDEVLIISKFGSTFYRIHEQTIIEDAFPFEVEFIQNANFIDHTLWICSTKGLFKFDILKQHYKHFLKEFNVSYVMATRAKQFWVCTLNAGVLYIESLKTLMYKTEDIVIRLQKGKNGMLFSTMTEEVKKIENNEVTTFIKGDSKHSVYQLYYDENKDILFYTSSKFNIITHQRRHTSVIPVKQIDQIDEKYYAYASSMDNGVFYINKNIQSSFDEKFLALRSFEEDGIHFIPLVENEMGRGCQYDAKNNVLYFLTNYGIRKYENEQITEINSNDYIFYTIQLVDDVLYFVNNEERVFYEKNEQLVPVSFDEIMNTKNIRFIRNINNSLALFTENAVYLYNPFTQKTAKLINISKENECNDIAILGDEYYVATDEGVIQMENDEEPHPDQVILFVNSVYANDEKVDSAQLKFLNYKDNNIVIHFSILSINPNTHYKLYYRVNDGRWEEIENSARNVKFSSLASGQYALQLRVVYDNNEVIQTIHLSINDPFWSSWWFITVVFFLFAVLIYIIYRIQIARINKKNRLELEKIYLEKNLNQSKLKSIKSQMNPHFFFNALNTLQSYILSNDKKQAVSYLSRFSQLTRTFLEMSDKDFITLAEELHTLELYLEIEKARFDKDFEYEILISKSINKTEEIRIPSVLLQPFVENAIKHGLLHKQGEKKLVISFTLDMQYLTVVIDDNGIGRKRSAELNSIRHKTHKSFATAAMDRRIGLLNSYNDQKITIEYIDKYSNIDQPTGTMIIINIPINH